MKEQCKCGNFYVGREGCCINCLGSPPPLQAADDQRPRLLPGVHNMKCRVCRHVSMVQVLERVVIKCPTCNGVMDRCPDRNCG